MVYDNAPLLYIPLQSAMKLEELDEFLCGSTMYQVSGHDCYGGTSYFFNPIHTMEAIYYWNNLHMGGKFYKKVQDAYIKVFQKKRYNIKIDNLLETLVYHVSRCHDDPEPSVARSLKLDMDAILEEARQNIQRNIKFYEYPGGGFGARFHSFYDKLKETDERLRIYGYYLIEEDENAEA